ncbi:MAG: LysE family translocator [Hyphomicrobiales bacterium]|nr:LysE family translocator [Hyphomicrobiales bacterium]MBV8425743.1 LysE family translocator [Hyphomicrobiales bacterium]MBV9740519.1 LysE family translocator [Hyphomicrobiales bacterium]
MENGLAPNPELWRPLLALILASIVIMGSPGPSTISVTAVGAAFGVRRSLLYAAGLVTGTVAVLAMVAAGVVALVLAIPHGARLIGAIAAVYILYLAYKIATAPPLEARSARTAAPSFAGGFLLAIANPKAYLAIAAVFAGTTIFAQNHGLDAAVKLVLLSLMIVIIHLAWLFAGAALSRFLRDPATSRLINMSLAAALVITTFLALMS